MNKKTKDIPFFINYQNQMIINIIFVYWPHYRSAVWHKLLLPSSDVIFKMSNIEESAEFYYPDDTEDINSDEEIVNFLKESLLVLELKPF